MNKNQPEQQQLSVVMQSLLYWEQEKLRALEIDEIRRRGIRCKPLFDFSGCLPRWEKRMRRRLSEVQILLEDVDPETLSRQQNRHAGV